MNWTYNKQKDNNMDLVNKIIKLKYPGDRIAIGKVKSIPNKENIIFSWVVDANEEFHKDVISFIYNAEISII